MSKRKKKLNRMDARELREVLYQTRLAMGIDDQSKHARNILEELKRR